MTTFAEVRSRAQRSIFLGPLSEAATYLPAGGGQSAVRVMIRPAQHNLREQGDQLFDFIEIDVRVAADPIEATCGGVARPQIGDGLVRSGRGEAADRAYSFERIIAECDGSNLLRFVRREKRQIGLMNRDA